ncbi:MAG: MMPL family transporter, partial [Deltaproteobacteria bacterium]|nr:MMPL family transporter [Deltaproteobacteria bacterium]
DTLAAVGEITDRAWQLPFATRVDSITNFQYSHAEEDDLIVDDLVDLEREYTPDELTELEAIALAEPLLKRRLISDEAHVTAIFVRHTLPREKSDEATLAALATRELAADIESKYPGHSVYLTGGVMLSNAFFEASVQDLSTLVPLMYLVLLITAFLFLRSFWGMLITLVIIMLSASTAMGIAGWIGIPLTPPSSGAPSKKEAMTESLRINLGPVFLTSLTTCIGLLGLNLSDVRPFNDLGNIATMGVTAAFIYTLVVLPVLVAIFPIRASKKVVAERSTPVVKLGEFVIAKRRGLLGFGVIAIAFLSIMVTRNELNDEFVKYFDESFAFRTDTDFTSENLSGIYTWGRAKKAASRTRTTSQTWTPSPTGRDSSPTSNMSSRSPIRSSVSTRTCTQTTPNGTPCPRSATSRRSICCSTRCPCPTDSTSTTRSTSNNVTAVRMRELQGQTEEWLHTNTPEHMWTVPASTNLMFSHISERNIKSSLIAAFIALGLIAIILMIAFRSVKFGALSILPNLAPALMAFGIWGMAVGKIDVGNAIIVDDSVHFLSKYLRARREGGMSSEEAVRYAFSTVGTALVVTSFILVAGFLILSLSPFGLNAGMGVLTAIVLLVALGADLLFLPPLLMQIDKAPSLSPKSVPSHAGAPAQ